MLNILLIILVVAFFLVIISYALGLFGKKKENHFEGNINDQSKPGG